MSGTLSLIRRLLGVLLVGLVALTTGLPNVGASPAGAQYGGVTGLFVSTSPDRPGIADFSGLGCEGNREVVLYWPGLQPTAQDPSATQTVPGRVLATTTSIASADPLFDGTFNFPNVKLPTDVEPGVYEVHARCGDLDLRVLLQIESNGVVTIDPDPNAPVNNETPPGNSATNGPNAGPPASLPLTGRDANRYLSLAAGFLAAGLAIMALSRREERRS